MLATLSVMASPRATLVTGATAGLGHAAAHQLSAKGHTVLVHGRSEPKVAALVAELEAEGGTAVGYVADLSSLADVRRLGADVAKDWPSLDGLLNNAGTFDGDYTGKRVETSEGNEYSLAVNVLAPFLLTSLLLPSLRASGRGRVVISSSVSMGAADCLTDLQLASSWDGHRAYSLSKLCDAMLSAELHSRYGDPPKLTFNTMDPTAQIGMGADTKMLRAGWGGWGQPAAKATISAEMMADEAWAKRSGEGFSGRREVSSAQMRKRLWDECVELTGAVFE